MIKLELLLVLTNLLDQHQPQFKYYFPHVHFSDKAYISLSFLKLQYRQVQRNFSKQFNHT